jgi:hypothetical protein
MNTKNTIMKTPQRRRRVSIKETDKKWIDYLKDVKITLGKEQVTNMSHLANKHGVTHTFVRFLTQKNIVMIDKNGYKIWNKSIPVDINLLQEFRKFQSEDKAKFKNENKTFQQEIQFASEKKRNTNSRKMSHKKWIIFLNECKNELNGFTETTVSQLTGKYNVTNVWSSFLTKNKIIEKNKLENWEWNRKIPVNEALINKFRKYNQEINKRYSKNKIENKPIQQELDLLIESTKQKNKPAIKINAKNLKTYRPYQEKQVGLIRKFLRWIY